MRIGRMGGRKAGTFSAFRVTDCEFSEFAGDLEGASRPISLTECHERCIHCTKREASHSQPRPPFGKLAIWGTIAAKASPTQRRRPRPKEGQALPQRRKPSSTGTGRGRNRARRLSSKPPRCRPPSTRPACSPAIRLTTAAPPWPDGARSPKGAPLRNRSPGRR